MSRRRSLARFAALALLPMLLPMAQALAEGAFGVTKGTRVTALPACHPMVDQGWYHCRSLPLKDDRFQYYWLQYAESIGVCVVTAVAALKKEDGDGAQVRRDFETIRQTLLAVYGPAEQYDILLPESRLTEPADWMKGLAANQRLFSAEWDNPGRDGLARIDLRVKGLSPSSGRVELEFDLPGYQKCDQAPPTGALP